MQNLRSNGIDVTYDGDLLLGERLTHFMESSISNSDIVLFICTPKYKYRADRRIKGVGTESQIITGELYETCNEKKFIPVLFAGTWETSLPTWAKGKLGVDLSTPGLYKVNFQKLLLSLMNKLPKAESYESVSKYTDLKAPTDERASGLSGFKEKIAKIFNVNTFMGLLLVTIIGGVIVNILQQTIPQSIRNSNSTFSDDSSNSSINANNLDTDGSIPSSSVSDSSIPDGSISDSQNPDAYDILLEDIILSLEKYPSNGTLPKGTTPINITLQDGINEKLASIQKLAIGTSKKWIDDKLGPPYAETIIDIKDDGVMLPHDNESNKTGEILICTYNVFDIVMVQACFDISDNSCQAFFVTLLDDISDIDIKMAKFYSPLVSDKSLGEFSFSEIDQCLVSTYGYAGQGIGRAFYGEQYNFGARGNYKNFYFAVLDYGMLNSRAEFSHFLSIIQFVIGPADNSIPLPDVVDSKRNNFYPNTYGISALNARLTFDLLSDYYWFDNLPLSSWDY